MFDEELSGYVIGNGFNLYRARVDSSLKIVAELVPNDANSKRDCAILVQPETDPSFTQFELLSQTYK